MKYIKIFILFLIVLFFIIYLIYFNKVAQKETSIYLTNFKKLEINSTKKDSYIPQKQKSIKNRYTPPPYKEAINLFEKVDIDILKDYMPIKDGIKPILAVKISKDSIKNLKIGDKIVLPYIDNEYEAKVIQKKINKNGDVSIIGKILDTQQENYSIILSEGKQYSFGTINLPNQSLEIELFDGRGYIYSVNEIDNNWIDYSKDDFISLF